MRDEDEETKEQIKEAILSDELCDGFLTAVNVGKIAKLSQDELINISRILRRLTSQRKALFIFTKTGKINVIVVCMCQ
jgi:hypothetical protein